MLIAVTSLNWYIAIMKKLLSLRIATSGLLVIFSLVIVFHLLVVIGIIPTDIVWGGNIRDKQRLWILESISITLNILMLLFVCAYAGIIKVKIHLTLVKVVFWILFVIFVLNTLGNIFAMNSLETYIFTPITFLLAIFCFRIALDPVK